MKNFNKEEFWNPLREISPAANQDFCDWIDEYKKEVKWKALFPTLVIQEAGTTLGEKSIKFHDLPIEMQIGILEKYLWEKYSFSVFIYGNPIYGFWAEIICYGSVPSLVLSKTFQSNSPNSAKIEGIKKAFQYIHEQRGK